MPGSGPSILWDLRGDGGVTLPTGTYYLDLDSTDPNGNVTSAETSIVLDQSVPQTSPVCTNAQVPRADSAWQDARSGADAAQSPLRAWHGTPRQRLRRSDRKNPAGDAGRRNQTDGWRSYQRLDQEAMTASDEFMTVAEVAAILKLAQGVEASLGSRCREARDGGGDRDARHAVAEVRP